uniref:Bardet-Biedl syndrome 10 protein n=1 Tax=Magallana gigas TaxID=29159 RepID=A0A8W8KDX6_MAGGI
MDNNQGTELKLLDFSKSLQIARALESLVLRGFGPQGLQTLMCTSTGQVLVTNNGATIFNALHIGHPAGRLMVKAIDKMIQYTGDGSKTFIVMLSEILQQIDRKYTEKDRGKMIREVTHFTHNVFPVLQKQVLDHSRTSSLINDKKAFCDSFDGVLRSVISPHYSARVVENLVTTVTSSFNFDLPSDHFYEQVSIITRNLSQFVVKTVGPSVTDSTTLDSFIIQRDFALHLNLCPMEKVRFVILMCSIEEQVKQEDNESIYLSTNDSLRNFMLYQRKRVDKFAQMCVEQKINVVISSVGIPKYCLQVLASRNISVIHYLEEEDVEFLSQMCRKHVILEFPRVQFTEKEIFVASSCQRVIIGGKPCVQLTPCGEGLAPYTKTLILAAPTDSLCGQLYTVIHKAIKSVYLSLILSEGPSCSSATIPGGTSFELMCSHFLTTGRWCKSKTLVNEGVQMASILAGAFVGVARILHRNVTETTQNQTRDFLIKLSRVWKRDADMNSLHCLGFDRRGTLLSNGLVMHITEN